MEIRIQPTMKLNIVSYHKFLFGVGHLREDDLLWVVMEQSVEGLGTGRPSPSFILFFS